MITWNIDPQNYSKEDLEDMLTFIEGYDYAIAKEIASYLLNTYSV